MPFAATLSNLWKFHFRDFRGAGRGYGYCSRNYLTSNQMAYATSSLSFPFASSCELWQLIVSTGLNGSIKPIQERDHCCRSHQQLFDSYSYLPGALSCERVEPTS